ncbi:MAG: class I SAM-dependent methyltransferase [Acidobacteriaceae bacterium]
MHTIRPYRIFTALPGSLHERYATIPIPPRRGYGGVSMLEAFLLIASCKLVNAKRLFEFGTFMGSTTLALALNSPADATVTTFDLGVAASGQQHQDDAPLTALHLASKDSLDFMGSPVAHKVTALTGDSLTYDFSARRGTMNWIFVDGGHDLACIKADTENAFRMIDPDKPACIAWHDYRNSESDYAEMSGYLEDLATKKPVFHVADTMLCFWFNDPDGKITPSFVEK